MRGALLIITLGETGINQDFAQQSRTYAHPTYKLTDNIHRSPETRDRICHVHNNVCGTSHTVGAQ